MSGPDYRKIFDEYTREPQVEYVPAGETYLRDMPESVLDGRLGEICATRLSAFPRAYAWPALLAAASALVDEHGHGVRTNLYVALVGPVHSGKTQAIQHAIKALGVESPVLMDILSGSAEQLIRKAKDAAGNPRLFSPDELGHLFDKMRIQGSSFPYILNRAFYDDKFEVLMGQKETAEFNCALSIVGGMVEDRFQDLFSAGTTGGLYDRFLFGQCPGGHRYDYFPFEGEREALRIERVVIDPGVWRTKSEWLAEDPELNPRVAEIAIRAATVCAALSGERVLRPAMLGPARELAKYQTKIRKILKPNPGENFEARLAHKFLAYLERHPGRFVSCRDMYHETHAYDLGPSTADRAVNILEANGDVETTKIGRKRLIRRLCNEDEITLAQVRL
jgi:hypothetical protein